MKNVTKILTAVTLCAAIFASDQRIDALGGNAAFWPGDEANIANFPGRINDHAFVQLTGVGGSATNGDAPSDASASILWNDGTNTWGFDYNNGGDDWFNINWGGMGMGLSVGMINSDNGADGTANVAKTGYNLGWGKTFDFGEIGVTMSSSEWNKLGTCYDATSGDATEDDESDCATGGDDWVAAHDDDASSMGLNFAKDMDLWAFDTILASYSSDTECKTCDTSTNMSVDFVSHMDAGGAAVVWAMGLDMDDTGASAGDTKTNSMKSTLAVEANMTDWATLRGGVNHTYNLSSDAGNSGQGFTWAWGLGFNWGGLTADYSIHDSKFLDPIGTITGEDDGQTAGALTTESVTFTYSF